HSIIENLHEIKSEVNKQTISEQTNEFFFLPTKFSRFHSTECSTSLSLSENHSFQMLFAVNLWILCSLYFNSDHRLTAYRRPAQDCKNRQTAQLTSLMSPPELRYSCLF
ncbi:hypothetical protein X801_00401, partial [Opisthorchis viverrini]